MGGTLTAQIINVVIAPIITRIYSPGLFGDYAVFLAVVNLIVITSTLKYEQAIFLPKEEEKASNILVLALFFVVIISTIIFIISLSVNLIISNNNVFLKKYSWINLIPVLVLVQGIYFCLRNWISRKGNYRLISTGMIIRILVANLSFILLAHYHYLGIGLIVGTIIGQSIETILILVVILNRDRKIIRFINYKEIIRLFHRYKDFPKYSLSAELINSLCAQNPVFMLSTFYNPGIVGNYSLVQRVLGLPINLFSSSTLEVFKKKASNEKNQFGSFDNIYIKTFFILLVIGIIPAILFWFFLPDLFPLIFGPKWVDAGKYARYLSIMFLFQFTISPLGFSLYIAEKQRYNLYWQILLLVFTSLGLLIGLYYKSANLSILLFSLSYAAMYILYFYWGLKFSKEKNC